jgi:hypothetical protein
VREHVDEQFSLALLLSGEHHLRSGAGGGADLLERQPGVQVEVVAQGVGEWPPHVGLTVRNAGTLEHRGIATVANAPDDLVDQATLAHAVLAVHVQEQGASVLLDEIDGAVDDGEFAMATDEALVAPSPPPSTRGSGGSECQPGPDGLLAAARLLLARRLVLEGV